MVRTTELEEELKKLREKIRKLEAENDELRKKLAARP
jgi:hypothetical protein